MKRRTGSTTFDLLVGVAITMLGASVLVVEYRQASIQSDISQVHWDMYTTAVALEAYYTDNGNTYPAASNTKTQNMFAFSPAGKLDNCRTFRLSDSIGAGLVLNTLTTPVAYLTSYPSDPFSFDVLGATYLYYSAGSNGWILGSWGPDLDSTQGGQLGWCGAVYHPLPGPDGSPGVETAYDPINMSQPSLTLLAGGGPTGAFTYDPTNGEASAGDIWRVRAETVYSPTPTQPPPTETPTPSPTETATPIPTRTPFPTRPPVTPSPSPSLTPSYPPPYLPIAQIIIKEISLSDLADVNGDGIIDVADVIAAALKQE